jgi:hypothetical protein
MGKKFIIRCNRAGVFFGEIEKIDGNQVVMKNVRKLWHWRGACAVEQLAQDGTARPNDCEFTVVVPTMTVLDPIQIIPCTEAAAKSIMAVREWRYER